MIVIDTTMEEIIYIAILKLKSKNIYFRLDVLRTVSPIANTLIIQVLNISTHVHIRAQSGWVQAKCKFLSLPETKRQIRK